MKDVVRKKLGVSTSTPVYLSQLRDGRKVDLEDGNTAQTSSRVHNSFSLLSLIDDDFEAFSSSAYHGLTARVKVTVGVESSATAEKGNQSPQSAVSRVCICDYFSVKYTFFV